MNSASIGKTTWRKAGPLRPIVSERRRPEHYGDVGLVAKQVPPDGPSAHGAIRYITSLQDTIRIRSVDRPMYAGKCRSLHGSSLPSDGFLPQRGCLANRSSAAAERACCVHPVLLRRTGGPRRSSRLIDLFADTAAIAENRVLDRYSVGFRRSISGRRHHCRSHSAAARVIAVSDPLGSLEPPHPLRSRQRCTTAYDELVGHLAS